MTLHTVNRSPFQDGALEACLRFAAPGDSILLLEDGVYAAMLAGGFIPAAGDGEPLQFYALAPDVAARGLTGLLGEGVTTVGYDGFVELTEAHERVVSWF